MHRICIGLICAETRLLWSHTLLLLATEIILRLGGTISYTFGVALLSTLLPVERMNIDCFEIGLWAISHTPDYSSGAIHHLKTFTCSGNRLCIDLVPRASLGAVYNSYNHTSEMLARYFRSATGQQHHPVLSMKHLTKVSSSLLRRTFQCKHYQTSYSEVHFETLLQLGSVFL